MSLPLTKIGIIYTQGLQEEKIFTAHWSTKMLRNLSKKVKENFPVMHLATPW